MLMPKPKDMELIRKLNLKDPRIMLSTWFGLGLLNPAPGTWGSLGAIPFGLIILTFGGVKILALATVIIFLIGLKAAQEFEKQSGEHDSKMIVIDEVAGMWLTMLPMTALAPVQTITAFVLFRFFDALKPWPISWIDKNVDGAFGVMIDDIAAGIAAAACLWGAIYAGLI